MRMMDPRRLELLVAFARLRTMTAVAAAAGYSTSAVSHQLAVLEKEAGVPLLERDGRLVRLTPAGHRLVAHAERILRDMEAADADLSGTMEISGTVRAAAFASAITAVLLPVCARLRDSHPRVELEIQEREPDEVAALLDADETDLGLVYDYSLRPRFTPGTGSITLLRTEPIFLITPQERDPLTGRSITGPADLSPLQAAAWITNSRGSDDDELASRVCGLAGFAPRIVHRADSVDLVQKMVAAGLGVALIPGLAATPGIAGLTRRPLAGIPVSRRLFARTRPGRAAWPPVALILTLAADCTAQAGTKRKTPSEELDQ